MQGMQQAEKGDGIQAKEGGMPTDYPVGEAHWAPIPLPRREAASA